MIDFLVNDILKSPAGSFSFIFSLLGTAFWLVHYVTKRITEINTGHTTLNNSVSKIESHIYDIRRDMSYVKGSIDVLNRGVPPVTRANSPTSLTDSGEQLSKELEAEKMIDRNWDHIFDDLEKNISDKNAYDIQQYCVETASIEPERFLKDSDLSKLKEFAYSKGNPLQYYMPIFGILIRGKYLKIKDIHVSEIDKCDPTKQDKVMTEVMKVGLDVFGSAEKLRLWLNNPSYALGDREPIELLPKDSDGKELVINELTRVRYGIFA